MSIIYDSSASQHSVNMGAPSISSCSTAQSHTHLLIEQRSQGHVSASVVRPVPVWIADQSGIAKKTSIASLTGVSASPALVPLNLASKLSSDSLKGLDKDSKHTRTQSLGSKSGTYSNSLPYTTSSFLAKNPCLSVASQDHALTDIRARQHTSNLNPPSSSNNGASRWSPFVASLNPSSLTSGTQIGIDELNQQADLDGEWTGHYWEEEESRRSLASKRGNPLTRMFQTPKKRVLIIEEQSRKSSLQSSQGNLPYSSKAMYLVSEQSRKHWTPKLNFVLLNNPHIPVLIRLISFILSSISLGLACTVFVKTRVVPGANQPASTLMAIACQSVALVYLIYTTYDEYTGKPLGLRDIYSKMRLIMLDLLFIIFSSANLSLAFNTLYDSLWLCNPDGPSGVGAPAGATNPLYVPYDKSICERQRLLASFLFLCLISWVTTFTISIFRLLERVIQ